VIAHATNSYTEEPSESVVLHLHPQSFIELSRFPDISDDRSLNAVLYAQRLEMGEAIPEQVGFLPHMKPGSEKAVSKLYSVLKQYRTAALKHHGITVRGLSLEECVARVEYVESAARAAVLERLLDRTPFSLSHFTYDKGTLDLKDMPHIPTGKDMTISESDELPYGPLRFGEKGCETTKEVITPTLSTERKLVVIVLRWTVAIPVLGILAIGIVAMTMPALTLRLAAVLFGAQILLAVAGIKLWSVTAKLKPQDR
jgi:hypothetical protein